MTIVRGMHPIDGRPIHMRLRSMEEAEADRRAAMEEARIRAG